MPLLLVVDRRASYGVAGRRPRIASTAPVRTIADRVVVLNGGAIVEAGATDDVLDRPQADYTRELLADTPSW